MAFVRVSAIFLFFLFILSGCYPISQEWRPQANKELSYSTVMGDLAAYKGSFILWGGIIVDAQRIPEGTKLSVLQTPLNGRGRPVPDRTEGIFIAKTIQVLDLETYGKGRMVTLAGRIAGEERKTGRVMEYTYPIVEVKQLFLWKEKVTVYPQHKHGWDWGLYGPHRLPLEQDWGGPDEPSEPDKMGERSLPSR